MVGFRVRTEVWILVKATRRSALWRADLDGGVCPAPEECVEELRDRERITVVLEHREHGLTATRQTFEASLIEDVEWRFTGLTWPADLRVGAFVIATWQSAKDTVTIRSIPLEEPVRIDGLDYFHEYDPRVVTREFDAGTSNRGQVLLAVRKKGRIFSDGSAVLAEAGLAAQTGLGRGARGAFLLKNALDQLIRDGYLTRVDGSADSHGYPSYPAVEGQKEAELLFYAPLVEEAHYPGEDDDDEGSEGTDRRDHWVNGFVRRLPSGSQPSERQLTLHEKAVETDELDPSPLAPGYTFVKKHHRPG